MKVTLKTTQKKFDEIWKLYDGTRETTKEVKIPKELLLSLLTDHGEMCVALEKCPTIEIGEENV